MNTLIEYMYRDADNYKMCREMILEGELTTVEFCAMLDACDEGTYFIPSQVDLDDLQSEMESYPDEQSDHVWHELLGMEPTDDRPTCPAVSAQAFYQRFITTTWDEAKAMDAHGNFQRSGQP